MPDVIQLLPDAIANQIAAGEVVQRPASIVKELLENAVDARSKSITLIVRDAGKSLVQVIDDGCGMSPTDARMCFERHATSKISVADDLFRIKTKGFRGEAMASIAAVARVELRTKREEDDTGTLIIMEASEVGRQEAIAWQEGTSIAVKNLFYNVPARRNFLKSNPSELKHIIDEFQRVALAHPEIAFKFYQNDLEVYLLGSGKLSQRIVELFGKNYRSQLAACKEETEHLAIHGYIGKPEFAKKNRGEQFFFVNNRFIKSPYLNHAVMTAYEGLLQKDSFPFYVLFIDIAPQHVDVNVHPTKTEIKFDDERTVYGIVQAAVKQAIGTHNLMPALDFDQDVNFIGLNRRESTPKSLTFISGQGAGGATSRPIKPDWQQAYAGFERREEEQAVQQRMEAQQTMTMGSAVNQRTPDAGQIPIDAKRTAFQIHARYIATQVRSGLMLIDQKAAHERILYERYLRNVKSGSGSCQQFLFPQHIQLNLADYALVMEMKDDVMALGFNYESLGKDTVVINGAPPEVGDRAIAQVFEGLIEQFKNHQKQLSVNRAESLAHAMASKAALKTGQGLNAEEMINLIDQLFGCENPNYAPNGAKTFYLLEMEQLADFFNS